jgi:rfaE bifunctional protein kinase chain/domain
MTAQRLTELLARFPQARVAVFGDYFLDKYLICDAALTEASLETGLDAYQVVEVRCSPGAAGTVTNNLAALEVGEVVAVGFVGEDGEGFELRRGLEQRGVRTEHLLTWPGMFTATYTKPMLRDADGHERELNRLDIKNRAPNPAELEVALLERLRLVCDGVDAVIIADQVAERELGVVSDRMRGELAALARSRPEVVFFADSRANISLFREVIIKPNKLEAARSVGYEGPEDALGLADAQRLGPELSRRLGKPVFVTVGAEGIVVVDGAAQTHVPAAPVTGPVDIVGAGDSTTAGIVGALCAGASLCEAAVVGNCVASLTIQQLGTTGTASRAQVSARFCEHAARFSGV